MNSLGFWLDMIVGQDIFFEKRGGKLRNSRLFFVPFFVIKFMTQATPWQIVSQRMKIPQ